jgi:transcription elongation factor
MGKSAPKRKREGHGTDRPEATFFDSRRYENQPECIERDEDGKRQEDMWKFRGSIFRNGLLEMEVVMTGLNFNKVDPTKDELTKWLDCQDKDVALAARNTLAASRSEKHALEIKPGDRIEVKQGWAQGQKGRVQSIEGDVLLVDDISAPSPLASIPITDVRKYFVVGDLVCIMSGPKVGLVGWCIKIEGQTVMVSEHGTNEEVSSLHSLCSSHA